MIPFVKKVQGGLYRSNKEAQVAFNQIAVKYQNKPEHDVYLKEGFTYNEMVHCLNNPSCILEDFAAKKIFVQITQETLDQLLQAFLSSKEERLYLRFGQYVYNKTNYEVGLSYEIKDTQKAYELLQTNLIKE